MAATHVLAIDQGTTSTRAVVFDREGRSMGRAAIELRQYYPRPGWVEHDPAEIWRSCGAAVAQALAAAGLSPRDLAALGVTNQRETVLLWDRQTGTPATPAIVWQDRRTADFCRERHRDEPWLFERTGLVLDPYFSATKIRWLLAADPDLRARAEAGHIAVGTVDSWLLWNLTGGKVHATDVSNASRTQLLDLRTGQWDGDLCAFFDIPRGLLPEVHPSAARHGTTVDLGFLPAGLPLTGMVGDQQAALFGQGCQRSGEAKCTYGTGAFFLVHTGSRPVPSRHRLLTSIAATTSAQLEYVLEGSVFVAGAAIQWLRDGLGLLSCAADSEALAIQAGEREPALLVPGFVGLGAPHWEPDVRGVLFGLTRATDAADLAHAALEGVALQVVDLVAAADRDVGQPLHSLRVDGGMASNAWFLRRQADLLGRPLLPAADHEATALGAAFLAGLEVGIWPDLATLQRLTQSRPPIAPRWDEARRQRRLAEWHRAVQSVIQFYSTNETSPQE